jgi:hypothetical protein
MPGGRLRAAAWPSPKQRSISRRTTSSREIGSLIPEPHCNEGPPRPQENDGSGPAARPQGDFCAATSRRAPEQGRGLSALLRSRSDWTALGHVSPAAGLMDLRCRM